MSRLRTALAGCLIVAIIVWIAIASRGGEPSAPASADRSSSAAAAPSATGAAAKTRDGVPAALPAEPVTERRADAPAAAPAFASYDEDGKLVADAVRDGLVLVVRTPAGAPCAELPITVHWRKGFGLYGKDVGRTDAAGRFATTVASVDQFEYLEAVHDRCGALGYTGDLLPSAHDPRTVEMIVPDLGRLRVLVVDGAGRPVGGAKVTAHGGAQADAPRQHVFSPGEPTEVTTDAEGAVALTVLHGSYDLTASADDCTSPQGVRTQVGGNGGDATLVLLRSEHRIDVDVRLTLPPGVTGPTVAAWTKEAPPRTPAMRGQGLEPDRREFFVDRQSDVHFVVRAEDVPWRVVARAEGCKAAIADVPRGQHEVLLVLTTMPEPEARPSKARLVVTVLGLDGLPARADVRVHETPDYVHGSDVPTGADGRVVVEREPKGRVCVSARSYRVPWVVSAPIELTAGDHEVTLRFSAAQTVSGRVVDAQGQPVQARVALGRPAGPLRGLAPDVPEILEHGPTSDSYSGIVDGRFTFEGCGPGEHVVWAFPERGWPVRKRVTPGVEATLVLGEGIDEFALVSGTVRDAVTLAPLAGVVIRSDADCGGWHNETDADGAFRFVARPGAVDVQMRKRDHVVHTVTTANVPRGPLVLDLRLPPSPVLFVRVVDGAGTAIADAEIGVVGGDGELLTLLDAAGNYEGDDVTTNDLGRADLRGAPAGVLRLRVSRGDEKREFDVPASAGRDGVFEARW